MRGLCADCYRPAALNRLGRPLRLCADCQRQNTEALAQLVTDEETLSDA